MEFELNGFDESGIIGENLRFIRVGLDFENRYRPFVYNSLHFGSVLASKRYIRSIDKTQREKYIRMILADPVFNVDCYYFDTAHQIDVLRQYILLEQKNLYKMRGELLEAYRGHDAQNKLSDVIAYLQRYEKTPFCMESFVKAYAFRMVVADLKESSKLLRKRSMQDYRAFTFIDGGPPFAFWYHDFLSKAEQMSNSCFSMRKTPIFGIVDGDEYNPVVSVAGNLAVLTSSNSGAFYPHNARKVPIMNRLELNDFYNLYKESNTSLSGKRIVFAGDVPHDFRYLLPFSMQERDFAAHTIRQPFRLTYKKDGDIHSFERFSGKITNNDIVVLGDMDKNMELFLIAELNGRGEIREAHHFLDIINETLNKISEEARNSNLTQEQVAKVEKHIVKTEDAIKNVR